MTQQVSYVCGLLMSLDAQNFAVIKKNRPDWQRNKWNGIGGKIEPTHQYAIDGLNNQSRLITMKEAETFPWDKDYIKGDFVLEQPHVAMHREFLEETGVNIAKERWRCFLIEYWDNKIEQTGEPVKIKVYYFVAFGFPEEFKYLRSTTDEEVAIKTHMDYMYDNGKDWIPNLTYILAMLIVNIRYKTLGALNPEGINNVAS